MANLTCDDCGKEKEDVKHTICPFAYEIHDKEVDVTLCDECKGERAMDI